MIQNADKYLYKILLRAIMTSIFTDKTKEPNEAELKNALGDAFILWEQLVAFTKSSYPKAIEEWKYSGVKYGWSFRVCDQKRVIIYLLPREQFFKIAFIFGQKATDKVLESNVSQAIKDELQAAKVYAEGRGIRIDVKDDSNMKDFLTLISIKISS